MKSQSSAATQATSPAVYFVDAIEEGVARLIPAGNSQAPEGSYYSFPAALLPIQTTEGSYISLSVQPAPPPQGEEVEQLRRDLLKRTPDPGGDLTL